MRDCAKKANSGQASLLESNAVKARLNVVILRNRLLVKTAPHPRL
jgi:hypothetical protein